MWTAIDPIATLPCLCVGGCVAVCVCAGCAYEPFLPPSSRRLNSPLRRGHGVRGAHLGERVGVTCAASPAGDRSTSSATRAAAPVVLRRLVGRPPAREAARASPSAAAVANAVLRDTTRLRVLRAMSRRSLVGGAAIRVCGVFECVAWPYATALEVTWRWWGSQLKTE